MKYYSHIALVMDYREERGIKYMATILTGSSETQVNKEYSNVKLTYNETLIQFNDISFHLLESTRPGIKYFNFLV